MKKIIILALVGLLFGSCDHFLKEENRSGITNEDLYCTSEGFQTLRTSVYAQLRTLYGGTPWLVLAGTDLYQMPRGTTANGIYDYRTLYDTNGDVSSWYQNCYNAIQAVNAGLYYVSLADISEEQKAQYEAEFRFFRGFFHFLLIEQFGGIVINDEYTQTPVTEIPRSGLAESFQFVIDEMEAALVSELPDDNLGGEVCHTVVNHYLAKVYLTRAWDLGNTSDFETAKTYAAKVLAERGNNLTYTFEELWSPFHEDNNTEVIFAVQYSSNSIASPTSGNNQESLFGPYLGGGERAHKYMSTQLYPSWHVHSWFGEDDARYEGTFMLTIWEYYYDYYQGKTVPGVNKLAAVYPRQWDPVKAQEMIDEYRAITNNFNDLTLSDDDGNLYPGVTDFIRKWIPGFAGVADEDIPARAETGANYMRIYPFINTESSDLANEELWRAGYNSDFCQPCVKKFDMDQLVQFSTSQSYRNVVLASLSETMLLYAEACIGQGDYPTAEQYINQVLARPGNSKSGGTLTVSLPTTQEAALETYLIESGKELLGQYCGRWPELRRTKMLKTMYYKYNYDYLSGSLGADPIEQKLYRPIPSTAINRNGALSTADQNPGYNTGD